MTPAVRELLQDVVAALCADGTRWQGTAPGLEDLGRRARRLLAGERVHLVAAGAAVNETGADPQDARPDDGLLPDPDRWRAVVSALLYPWPTPAARAELAREVAAEAVALLAGHLTPDALRIAGALVSLALDVVETLTPLQR